MGRFSPTTIFRASRDHAFDLIRDLPVFETQADHFLKVLERGKVATNVFLRRLHNFAVDVGWLPWPILPKKQWPVIRFKPKRAIMFAEHADIVERERNPERKAFYELLWHLGGSQSDIAHLRAEDIDWTAQTVTYRRQKTKSVACLHFGDRPLPAPLRWAAAAAVSTIQPFCANEPRTFHPLAHQGPFARRHRSSGNVAYFWGSP